MKWIPVPNEVWVLPRPRMNALYPGGFPAYFERKLIRMLGIDETKKDQILHPFGGRAEYGIRCDLNTEFSYVGKDKKIHIVQIHPDYVMDAHNLEFPNNKFDLVILDPPYSDVLAEKLYKTPYLNYQKYGAEAVRVCKKGGFVVVYHQDWKPRLAGTKMLKRIILLVRMNQQARIVQVMQKQ